MSDEYNFVEDYRKWEEEGNGRRSVWFQQHGMDLVAARYGPKCPTPYKVYVENGYTGVSETGRSQSMASQKNIFVGNAVPALGITKEAAAANWEKCVLDLEDDDEGEYGSHTPSTLCGGRLVNEACGDPAARNSGDTSRLFNVGHRVKEYVDEKYEEAKVDFINKMAEDALVPALVEADQTAADCLADLDAASRNLKKRIDFFWDRIAPSFNLPAGTRRAVPGVDGIPLLVDEGTIGSWARKLHALDPTNVTDYMVGDPGTQREHLKGATAEDYNVTSGIVGYNGGWAVINAMAAGDSGLGAFEWNPVAPFPPEMMNIKLWQQISSSNGSYKLPYYYISLPVAVANVAEKYIVNDLGALLNDQGDPDENPDKSTTYQKYSQLDASSVETVNNFVLKNGVVAEYTSTPVSHPNYDPNSDVWKSHTQFHGAKFGNAGLTGGGRYALDTILNRDAFMLTSDTQFVVNEGVVRTQRGIGGTNWGMYGAGTAGGVSLLKHLQNGKTAVLAAEAAMSGAPAEAKKVVADYKRWLGLLEQSLTQAADATHCMNQAYKDFESDRLKAVRAMKALKNTDQFKDSAWVPNWLSENERKKARYRALIDKASDRIAMRRRNDLREDVNNKSTQIFREQCFLLAFAAKFAAHKKHNLDTFKGTSAGATQQIHKRLPYTKVKYNEVAVQEEAAAEDKYNASVQIDGPTFGFINRLTQSPNYEALVNIPHYQLSALQPKIRLFKVEYEEPSTSNVENEMDGALEREVEIAFDADSYFDLTDIFLDKKSRGAGCGLKNFEFTYDGSNPFSAKKSIKAKLTIFANSMSELFFKRTGTARYLSTDDNGDPILKEATTQYRYIDLALKTSTKPNTSDMERAWAQILEDNAHLAKLNFRLKAVVGWAYPSLQLPGPEGGTLQTRQLREAIKDATVTLNLTPTVHNFDFDQTGRVTLEINYLAYVEDFFDERAFNAFADTSGAISIGRDLRRMKMKQFRKRCASAEVMQEENEKYASQISSDLTTALASMIEGLMKDRRIYYLNMPYDKVQKFIASGPYEEFKNYVGVDISSVIQSNTNKNEAQLRQIQDALSAYARAENRGQRRKADSDPNFDFGAALFASGPDTNEVSFFYLSDLVDTVLKNIQIELDNLEEFYDKIESVTQYVGTSPDKIPTEDWDKRLKDLQKYKTNFKRVRVLLGPLELVHHKKQDGTYETVNFGDIPISVKYFMEWMTCKVLSKDEIFFPLSAFLNQLMNNLVTNFLNSNECFAYDIKQKVRLNQAVLTAESADDNIDSVTDVISLNWTRPRVALRSVVAPCRLDLTSPNAQSLRPILRSRRGDLGYAPLAYETNYLTYFAGRVAASNAVANRTEDEKAGLFHYKLGQDRGLVKEIKLRKTQTKGLAEARFEQDGYDGLQQLRVVYDVDITSYANVNTYPGTYIYIPPEGFDPAWGNYGFKSIDMTSLGIGGYYMIIRSTHKFGQGEASSEIFAKWVNSLETDYPNRDAGTRLDSNSEEATARQCSAAADRANWRALPADTSEEGN